MTGARTIPRRLSHAVLACGLLCALGCQAQVEKPGGASTRAAEKARREAETLAMTGVTGAAKAQAQALSQNGNSVNWFAVPKVPLRPGTAQAVVREKIISTVPYATEAEADEDAIALAREMVERKLAELDPPVYHKVSINEVKTEFLRKDSRIVRTPDAEEKATFVKYGVSGNLVYVEYDVEVSADQVRELRSQGRVTTGLRFLGICVAVALAGFLFLRADEWTRGYLTSWLALAAVLLAGGAVSAFLFI